MTLPFSKTNYCLTNADSPLQCCFASDICPLETQISFAAF